MAIDGYIIKMDYTQRKKLAAAVSRVASNTSQIYRRINSTGYFYADDIAALKERQGEIRRKRHAAMNAAIRQYFQDFEATAGMNDVKLYGGVPPCFWGEKTGSPCVRAAMIRKPEAGCDYYLSASLSSSSE